jgi:hypothetical protein
MPPMPSLAHRHFIQMANLSCRRTRAAGRLLLLSDIE